MKRHPIRSFLFAIFTLLLALVAAPAGAQAPESYLNLNAYQCPADYDEISDCTKLSGVVVAVSQDGQPLGQVTTAAAEGATLDLMFGAFISLEVIGGVPEGTVLADTTLSFDAVEGQNAVTLIFVPEEQSAPNSYLSLYAWWCPAEYEDLVDACTRLADVYVDVSQDGQPLGQVVTQSTGAATLALQEGAFIELAIAGGVPEGAVLESELDLAFTAVAGENPVMLVFVGQEGGAPGPPHSDLLVTKFTCPPGYEGNDFVGDCAPTEGVTFSIGFVASEFFASAPTNAEGLAAFSDISAGTYVIAEDIPGDAIERIEVFCAAPGDTEPRPLTVNALNSITVEVLAGEELSCTWYNVPVEQMAGASAITVEAYLCPADYAGKELWEVCDEPLEDVGVIVGLDASEFGVEGETDADGTVTFDDLGSGAYTVTLGVPGDFARFNVTCGRHTEFEFSVIAASTTNQISFELLESDEVLCVFLVIPESAGAPTATPAPKAVAPAVPTRPAGPVMSLPDTGSGSLDGNSETVFVTLVLVLLASVVSILLVVRRVSRS